MRKLIIDQSKVTNEVATNLVKICPFGAIEYKDGKLDVNSACKTCGACQRKYPNGPIKIIDVEDTAPKIDKNLYKGVCVFVELTNEGVHPVTFELIGKARELANIIHHPVYALLIASQQQIIQYQSEILSYGVNTLYVYEHEIYKDFNVTRFANCTFDFINKIKPSTILFGGTPLGRSFAPKIAAHFKTGLTADCTKLGMKENTDLIQVRPAFGGNVMAQIITTNTRPQLATVRPKIFPMPNKEKIIGQVIKMDNKDIPLDSLIKLIKKVNKEKTLDIAKSDVIVAIGRIFKNEDDIKLAKELANLLGGLLASSRPLVEEGIMEAKYQIGLSGKTVAPKLIITLGISGAVQFIAGMKGSGLIIAINKDKNAPIFDVAHYGIVADVFSFLPKLIDELRREKK
ncbi:MAG: FAD-binding protein [Bacilli bacterium]|nr:FAD-binding protein [Bacilli bacterium]